MAFKWRSGRFLVSLSWHCHCMAVALSWHRSCLAVATKLSKKLWGVKIWKSVRGIWGVFLMAVMGIWGVKGMVAWPQSCRQSWARAKHDAGPTTRRNRSLDDFIRIFIGYFLWIFAETRHTKLCNLYYMACLYYIMNYTMNARCMRFKNVGLPLKLEGLMALWGVLWGVMRAHKAGGVVWWLWAWQ